MTRYPETLHISAHAAELLDQPVDPWLLSSRTGRGTSVVHYLKGDISADGLNQIFGPLGWGVEPTIYDISDWEETKTVQRNNRDVQLEMHVVQVITKVTLTIKPMTKESTPTVIAQHGIGYGEIEVGKNRKEAVGMAVKGAETDGLKRCGSLLGKKLGMMLASNGEQDEIEYAHNGNATNIKRARNLRDQARRGSGPDGDRGTDAGPRPEQEVRQRRDQRVPGAQEARNEGKGRDASRSSNSSSQQNDGAGERNRRDERSRQESAARAEAPSRQDESDVRQPDGARGQDEGRGAVKEKGGEGKAAARTDFDLNSLPVSAEEMTDFAATLAARVKEMRQKSDRTALVRQHLNTITNLDPRIRRRLTERLHEVDVDVDLVRA